MSESHNICFNKVYLIFSGKIQQASDNFLATFCLFDNQLKVFLHRAVSRRFILENIGIHRYDAQRIVEFMGNTG
ncbi:hypothetical protein SDC9_117179 [bioreactor metagenome]|uniref:Uncharacterized protein n=1 Tax=bioreactor metagenome TaxID=1076179 RepID=A0A645BXH8_9ZZZZ